MMAIMMMTALDGGCCSLSLLFLFLTHACMQWYVRLRRGHQHHVDPVGADVADGASFGPPLIEYGFRLVRIHPTRLFTERGQSHVGPLNA